MKDQKLGEWKIIARIHNKKGLQIAYKSSGGKLYTFNAPFFGKVEQEQTSFYIGKEFTQVISDRDEKRGLYLALVQPGKDEKIKLELTDGDGYKSFIETDYNGKRYE